MNAGVNVTKRTRKRLADFLGSLPAGYARALADCVEEARLCGDTGLPHDLILDALQPALDRAEPGFGQGLTDVQLFALPFEDLIVEQRHARRRGRIAHSSVEAVWSWLLARGAEHGPADLLRGRAEGAGVARQMALEFWRVCARVITSLLADEAARAALCERPGGADAVEDARDMAAVLEIAGDALDIRERFARSHCMPSTSTLNALAVMFDDFADRHPGRAAHFFLVLAGCLEKPWEVLRVMDEVADRVHAKRLGAEDTDMVREALCADLEAEAEFFRRLNTAVFDPVSVADALRAFTRMVDGLLRAGLPEGGRWARRLAACRSDVAEKMEILMERAPRDIMAALPVHKIGRFGRVRRRPDIGAPPDPARSERALRMARLLDGCRAYAADAAFKAAFSEAAADIREALGEYAAALIQEMARSDAEATAPSWLDLVTRLTTHAVGPEEAGRLRRDAATVAGLTGTAVS